MQVAMKQSKAKSTWQQILNVLFQTWTAIGLHKIQQQKGVRWTNTRYKI